MPLLPPPLYVPRGQAGPGAAARRFDEAEPLLPGSHEQSLAGFGPDDGDTRRAARRLAEPYEAWGRAEQAAPYREAAAAAGVDARQRESAGGTGSS